MDNEKNTLDEIKEEAEEVVETVEDAVNEAETAAEDFIGDAEEAAYEAEEAASEEISQFANEQKVPTGKIIAISSVIATIASIVIMLLGSYCINFVSGVMTAKNIEGTWGYELGGYNVSVYVMLDGKTFTLASGEGMTYFSCDYKFSGKNKLTLLPDDETKESMKGLVPTNSLEVTYDKEEKAITFNPSLGGISTWNAVEDETEIKGIKEAIKNYSENKAEVPSDNAAPEEAPADDENADDVVVEEAEKAE